MGFKTAEILERMSLEAGIPMPKLAIAWPLKRRFVTVVIIGFKSQEQPETNIEMGDWDMPDDVWNRREDPAGRGVSYLV
jgi:aryl-alcohol dehydrogenase-like predicted oxidoreductase